MRFGQNVLRMTWKQRFVLFSWKSHCFAVLKRMLRPVLRFWELWRSKNAIWPNRAAHDLKRAFCTVFMESALFSCFEENVQASVTILKTLTLKNPIWPKRAAHDRLKERFVQFSWKAHCFPVFEENFRPVWRFWELSCSKMRFGQNMLRTTWKRAFCTIFIKSVLFLPFWREFQASVTILRTLMLKNAIWPKRAAHDLKRVFCTILMKSALFFRFEENLRLVSRFWELWRSEIRFDKNLLRMTWKERFVQFL